MLTQNYDPAVIHIDHIELTNDYLWFMGTVQYIPFTIEINGSLREFDRIQKQLSKGISIESIVSDLLYNAYILTQ